MCKTARVWPIWLVCSGVMRLSAHQIYVYFLTRFIYGCSVNQLNDGLSVWSYSFKMSRSFFATHESNDQLNRLLPVNAKLLDLIKYLLLFSMKIILLTRTPIAVIIQQICLIRLKISYDSFPKLDIFFRPA